METTVGILAIGNEVVEGQITNRNAAWLSERLSELGAQPLFHLSCRDNNEEILSSMKFLSSHCHLVLVSGGLGPTKDDFTRQSLSQWLRRPLELNENLWKEIKSKLESRNLTIRDGHKNQALIPKGATSLKNTKGVAPGFFIKAADCFLASLPGPPSELQTMFSNELKPLIIKNLAPKSDVKLQTWICLGAPESEIAHITESIIGDSVEVGYRLYKPYVEVKLWLPHTLSSDLNKKILLMEDKLNPWLVGRSVNDIRKKFHGYLKKFEHVFVIDHLTSGLMLEKLKEGAWSEHLRYQCFEHNAYREFQKSEVQDIHKHMGIGQDAKKLFITLFAASENSAHVSFNDQIHTFELPRKIPVRSTLGQLYIIERCFLNHG